MLRRLEAWSDRVPSLREPGSSGAWFRLVLAARAYCVRALVLKRWNARAFRWRDLRPHIDRLMATHADRRAGAAAYETSAVDDSWPIRVSMLLGLLGRYEESVRVLVRRYEHHGPGDDVGHCLARLLEECHEGKTAALIRPSFPASSAGRRCLPAAAARRRHAIVMLTMFDSSVFRASLRSLTESDFCGQLVVVEDGALPEPSCRTAAEESGADYVRCESWVGSAAAMNRGIARLPPDTDTVTFVHNDVLWPARWFAPFDAAWNQVIDGGRVGLVNLPYLQFKRRQDAGLADLFARGRYESLLWLLRAMRGIPSLAANVQACEVLQGEHPFGLSRDPWNDWLPEARQMTGRFSVAASFPYAAWQALGGFSEDLPYGFDLELQQWSIRERRWMLFVDTPPLIHQVSSDTRALGVDHRMQFVQKVKQTYAAFEARSGMALDHFLNIYFSEVALVHRGKIVPAVNRGAFEDIDFLFDVCQERLADTRLDNCEIAWCRRRATCPYN